MALVLPCAAQVMRQPMRLCGGTALSRFYLQHRLSYDLDFFVAPDSGFNPQTLAERIASSVPIFNLEISHDSVRADQLHFLVQIGQEPVRLYFVEDMYAAAFAPIPSGLSVAGIAIQTESVEGLYHRKLRTVVGWADSAATAPAGGRQTARDLFDLFVLSQESVALRPFIESLPYIFPQTAFEDGLANMRWFDLAAELSELIAAPAWQAGLDIEILQRHLYTQLDMSEVAPPDPPSGNVEDAAQAQPSKRVR